MTTFLIVWGLFLAIVFYRNVVIPCRKAGGPLKAFEAWLNEPTNGRNKP